MSEEKKLFVAAVRYERMDGLCRKFIVMAATKGEASDLVRIRCSSLHSPLGRELGAFVKVEEVSGIIEVSTERHIAQLAHSDLAPTTRRLPRMTDGRIDRGQALVEFALTIPIFLFLLLGGIQVGLALLSLSRISFASQQASVQLTSGTVDLSTIIATDAPSNTQVVSVTPCAGAGSTASVTLTAPTSSFIPLPAFPPTLTSTSVAACST